jgi:hypothetical protein
MGGNCWSRGRKVRLLLGFAPVECRPSWAPPISMHTVLVFPATRAIGVKAHCLHGKTFKSEDDVPQKGGWADRGPQRWPSRSSQLIHWGVVACPALPLLRGGVVLLRGRCRSVALGRSRLGAECFFMVLLGRCIRIALNRVDIQAHLAGGTPAWEHPLHFTTMTQIRINRDHHNAGLLRAPAICDALFRSSRTPGLSARANQQSAWSVGWGGDT